jgi:protein-disulfide isomerase
MAGKLTPPVNKNDHIHGPHNAATELVQYGDFQCPHCGMAYPVVKEILKAFQGQIKFIFRHFPLSNVHEYAVPAAIAAEAAGRQKKFWEMHDVIYENQSELSNHALAEWAAEIGLDMVAFKRDIKDDALLEKVENDFESGVRSGVNGTPSFFINGYKYNGDYGFDSLFKAIEMSIDEAQSA